MDHLTRYRLPPRRFPRFSPGPLPHGPGAPVPTPGGRQLPPPGPRAGFPPVQFPVRPGTRSPTGTRTAAATLRSPSSPRTGAVGLPRSSRASGARLIGGIPSVPGPGIGDRRLRAHVDPLPPGSVALTGRSPCSRLRTRLPIFALVAAGAVLSEPQYSLKNPLAGAVLDAGTRPGRANECPAPGLRTRWASQPRGKALIRVSRTRVPSPIEEHSDERCGARRRRRERLDALETSRVPAAKSTPPGGLSGTCHSRNRTRSRHQQGADLVGGQAGPADLAVAEHRAEQLGLAGLERHHLLLDGVLGHHPVNHHVA